MRLAFDPTTGDDEEAFSATRDTLLDEFDRWRTSQGQHDDGSVVANAGMFLDWRYGYSTGVLNEYLERDLDEFLLGWVPRKYSAPADEAPVLCRAVGEFVDFMAATDRLAGGAASSSRLTSYAEQLEPDVRRAMSDPANFGMAKSLLGGSLDEMPSTDDPQALQAFLDQKMAEFNSLPFEERKALTDPSMLPVEPEPAGEPYVHVPPPASEVVAAASAAPIATKIESLREYLGAEGRTLTDKGNLKLADGKALVELLDTGDRVDETIGGRTFKTKSTADMRRLQLIVELAKAAGAVRVHQRGLVPTKAWDKRDPIDRGTALLRAVVDVGPLWLLFRDTRADDVIKEIVDECLGHWLTMVLADDTVPFDEVAGFVCRVVGEEVAPQPPIWTEERNADSATNALATSVEVLELIGAIRWDDRVESLTEYGFPQSRGGALSLTALGKSAVPGIAAEMGYPIATLDDLGQADPADLFEAMGKVPDSDIPAVIASWQPELPPDERAQWIADAVVRAESFQERVAGLLVLDVIGPEITEPQVRQLLDSPAAAHAAAWLIAHDLDDQASVGHYIDLPYHVDVLASCQDDPEIMSALFLQSSMFGARGALLEQMWRHDAPETEVVLDVLGKNLPDRRLAKAARKALFKHRSRPNR